MPLRCLYKGNTAMTRGRPKADLVVLDDERAQLIAFARSRSLPASLSARARIVLSSAEGEAAYFSPSRTAFQSDRGRRFSVIADDAGGVQVTS